GAGGADGKRAAAVMVGEDPDPGAAHTGRLDRHAGAAVVGVAIDAAPDRSLHGTSCGYGERTVAALEGDDAVIDAVDRRRVDRQAAAVGCRRADADAARSRHEAGCGDGKGAGAAVESDEAIGRTSDRRRPYGQVRGGGTGGV